MTTRHIAIGIAVSALCFTGCSKTEPEVTRESLWKPAAEVKAAPPAASAKPAPSVAPKKPGPKAMQVTIAAGTPMVVRINETMTSEKNEVGDRWSGVLHEPLVVDGLVIAEKGSNVEGRVSHVKRAGRVKGNAELSVQMTNIATADGQKIDLSTAPYMTVGQDTTKKDATKIAVATGVGAAIGAITGKGKGAAIGAGAGAAGGTGVVLATRGGAAAINSESIVRFKVRDAITVTEKIK